MIIAGLYIKTEAIPPTIGLIFDHTFEDNEILTGIGLIATQDESIEIIPDANCNWKQDKNGDLTVKCGVETTIYKRKKEEL